MVSPLMMRPASDMSPIIQALFRADNRDFSSALQEEISPLAKDKIVVVTFCSCSVIILP